MTSATGPEVVKQIINHDQGRDPQRLALKYAKMRSSPFAFLRATAFLYFAGEPLPEKLAHSPRSWLCGDLHLENFGSYRGANGLVYFDINDFDEGSLAPVAWDLSRLVSSMLVAAAESVWPAQNWLLAAKAYLHAYSQALANGKPLWIERRTAKGPIRRLLRQLARRSQRDLLKMRTQGSGARRKIINDGTHSLPASPADQKRIAALLANWQKNGATPGNGRVLDVARRIAGTSSLGMERFVILVRDGKDSALLLDLKTEAHPASLVAGGLAGPWSTDAQRTVAIQTMMQAISPAGLRSVHSQHQNYVLRELQPTEDRLNINHLRKVEELAAFAAELGEITAWAHLRGAGRHGAESVEALIAFGKRRDWQSAVLAHARQAKAALLAQHRDFAGADSDLLLAKG